MIFHIQCKLRRSRKNIPPENYEYQTSWIPADIAIIGNVVKLKEEDGSWDEGWEVISVGDKLPTKIIIDRRMDYKNMKKMTDI